MNLKNRRHKNGKSWGKKKKKWPKLLLNFIILGIYLTSRGEGREGGKKWPRSRLTARKRSNHRRELPRDILYWYFTISNRYRGTQAWDLSYSEGCKCRDEECKSSIGAWAFSAEGPSLMYPQPKVGKSQEISVMGRLKIFWEKGKKP